MADIIKLPSSESSAEERNKSAEEHAADQTEEMTAWFEWADRVLQDMGVLDALRNAKTREQIDAIDLDMGRPASIAAIRNVLHPGKGKPRRQHFEHMTEQHLKGILRSRLNKHKKEAQLDLSEKAKEDAAKEEQREKREENVKLYGEFKQYKVLDHGGVYVEQTEELPDGEADTKWVQIARTRIDLLAVTRSKQDDNWGVYIQIVNLDGRLTGLAIPRHIITDRQGNIAGRLADLGVDVVRDQIALLPDFLLTTVEIAADDTAQELIRFLAVPTTGWCQLNNNSWVFVLPHTTKIPADLLRGNSGEMA